MGGGLALQALRAGYRVVGNDAAGASNELLEAGLVEVTTHAEMAAALTVRPRVVFLYVHAGDLVDRLSESLSEVLEPGDIMVDGGNSYWGDSVRRQSHWESRGLHFVDLGTSGGIMGARNGACFMIGGHADAKARVSPILQDLCVTGGFVDAGGPGAGHYVKLVHNGIEFGMLQAIGEGIELLERFPQDLPIPDVLSCWRNGSVIRSWLVDLMHEAYAQRGDMESVPGVIEDTGEVNWLVADALAMEVPIPVIAQSVMQLFASRDDDRLWARAIALMRQGFGGHPLGRDEALVHERRVSRVGEISRPKD